MAARPRVGLYYDLRNAGDQPWQHRYAAALEQISAAEALGVDAIWLSEHHGFADGYLPAPLTFAAAVAARTSRVRIGTAVVIAPLSPPMALAEQAAVVDQLSGGRLELGLGAGWREAEFRALGAEYRGRYTALEHAVRTLPELWRTGRATPPPAQQPVPLWVGARGPRGARIAGRTGAGLLWLDHELLPPYREALLAAGHPPERARMGGLVNVFLADDPEAARARIYPAGRRNRASYAGNDRAITSAVTGVGAGAGAAARREAAFPRLSIRTAAQAAELITERITGLPVTDVFCFADIGGLVQPGEPDRGAAELVARHVELVAGTLPRLLTESRLGSHADAAR
jgi:alkanesulfonate monooxygenase SsuD/methylene tetrahydromethanopterin reductase-like flavin-dependent oxidoreductase (luciferase family)